MMVNIKDAPSEDDALKIELEAQSLVKNPVKKYRRIEKDSGFHRQKEGRIFK